MEEKEIEVNGKKIKIVTKLPREYIEDNNLKIFLDDTVDLGEVVSEISSINLEKQTSEIKTNE